MDTGMANHLHQPHKVAAKNCHQGATVVSRGANNAKQSVSLAVSLCDASNCNQ